MVNKKISQDPILQGVFGGDVNIFPGYAGEPLGGNKSYPYIRYLYVPIIARQSVHIRRDNVQYIVGHKDLTIVARMIERLMFILNSSDNLSDFAVQDMEGKYKIMDIIVNGATPQVLPSQDEGVWEQGLNCTVLYTIVNPGWDVTHHVIDALLVD